MYPEEARLLRRNLWKVPALNSFWMFLIIMPIVVPFLREHDLDMHQIFLLQTVFAIAIVLFEVPSGYVADLFGRRNSLVAAGLFHGLAFTILAMADSFTGFLVFEVLAALGNSLFSGSDVALLYDSHEALGEGTLATRSLGRKLFWGQVGETCAAPIGGALVLGGLSWPAIGNAIVAWVPLCIALSLHEPRKLRLAPDHHANFSRLLSILFRGERLLRLTLFANVAYGLATLLAVWAFQGFWEELRIPLVLFGALWAGYNLAVAVTARSAVRLEERWGAPRVVGLIGLLPVAGYGGMALCGGWDEALRENAAPDPVPLILATVGGVLCGLFFQLGRGLNQVVIKGALNHRVPPELRATANSFSSLGVRIGFAILGPWLGWGIDEMGYPAAFGAACGLFVLVYGWIGLPLVLEISRGRALEPRPESGENG